MNELTDVVESLTTKLGNISIKGNNLDTSISVKKNSDIDEKYLTFNANVRDDNRDKTNLNIDEINFVNSATARTRYVQNLKIDDLLESNFNSIIKNNPASDRIIGNLTKNNNDFKFKIEELENFALRI
jgi:hypothetical protein